MTAIVEKQLTYLRIEQLLEKVGVFTLERSQDLQDVAAALRELKERRKADSEAVALRWRWNDNDAQWTYAPASKMPEFVAAGFSQENGVEIEYLYAVPQPVQAANSRYTDGIDPYMSNAACLCEINEALGEHGGMEKFSQVATGINDLKSAMTEELAGVVFTPEEMKTLLSQPAPWPLPSRCCIVSIDVEEPASGAKP
ncbi:TPA: hypothetical protein NQG57_000994 [Salmonella enterica subsp. enterica serovar Infantis]|nr:hypothetical protein [Salmonella enterica subsp. enterica serovar Infantis]HCJ0429061.1 hypothetical protein [Salmonella enterica subsp. enterica serovar Infantis]